MKRILILNLSAVGHHPRYCRWILECDACRQAEVILTGPSALFEHSVLRDSLASIRPHPVILSGDQEAILRDTSSTASLMRRQFAFWKIWQQTFKEVDAQGSVDVVVMVAADDCLDAVGVLGSPYRSAAWMGILLKPTFHFRQMGVEAPNPRFPAVRERLLRRALHSRSLAGLLTIDPTLDAYAEFHLPSGERQKLRFLPDPAPDLELVPAVLARKTLGIPVEGKVILAYGTLTERKGIISLIECASTLECPSNIFVLLAGEQSDEIATFLRGETVASLLRQKRLKVICGYVLDAEAASYLAAADCVWIGYQGFYMMSAVMVLAARHGIPCMVSDFGVAGYMVRKHQFGLAIDPNNRQSVLTALQAVSQDEGQLAAQARRGSAAFSRHSVTEFQRTISATIADAISANRRDSR
jgi:glycosyltransferase involved in cell wall biosynthesis